MSPRRIVPFVLIVAVVVVGVVIWRSQGDNKYVVKAVLPDAGGVLKNYNVKVGQVAAGKVTKIGLDKQDHAVLTMKLDKDAGKIGPGATAYVRPVNLLGEKYVDLTPGDVNHPMPSGSTIPITKTGDPVELDDALNILQPDVRGAMRILINEAGLSLAGKGADFNKTLQELPPALDTAKSFVGQVADENRNLDSLIQSGDRVLASIDGRHDDLNDLIDSAGQALKTADERRVNLAKTVQNAPAALGNLRTTLASLQSTATKLQPTADNLRTASPQLAETLQRAPKFAGDAQGALDEAVKTAPKLSRLGTQARPALRDLQPAAQQLAAFSTDTQAFTDMLDGQRGLKSVLGMLAGWANLTGNKDGLGHVFRLNLALDDQLLGRAIEQFTGAEQTPTTPKTRAKAKAHKRAPAKKLELPKLTVPKTDTSTTATPSAPAPKNPIGNVLDTVNNTVKGVVGNLLKPPGDGRQNGTSGQPTAPQSNQQSPISKVLNYLLGS